MVKNMWQQNAIAKILLLLLGGLMHFYCASANLFVDNNASPGGVGTKERPFQYIQQAADVVNPGDTVIIAPGIYFETIRLRRFGKFGKPIIFKADKIAKKRVIITGANPKIRKKEVTWNLFDVEKRIYVIPYSDKKPSRVLYDDVDIYPYQSFKALKNLESLPGIPGPQHGFVQEDGKLFLRLRADKKFGPSDPNLHTIAIAPSSLEDELATNSRAYNFGLLGGNNKSLYIVIDGLTFETPGRAAVYVDGDDVTIRNCYFLGCWQGGILGRRANSKEELERSSNRILVEFCEWHCFPIFDDAKELMDDVQSGKRMIVPTKRRFHWWVHKHRNNGVETRYEHGIVSQVGRNWIIRNNYIHDAFEALASLNWGENIIFEENRCERLIDNAVETENHAKNVHIRRNRFIDVYQSISLQPLDGEPWPGPVYVYQNLFYNTSKQISCKDSCVLKIGIQKKNWECPAKKNDSLKSQLNWKHITVPGMYFFNNSIITPDSLLFGDLEGNQRIENIGIYNNIAIVRKACWHRRLPGTWHAIEFYRYENNRIAWLEKSAEIAAISQSQICIPQQILPDWSRNSFIPAKFEASSFIADFPKKFEYIGAFQSPKESIAERTGIQEE